MSDKDNDLRRENGSFEVKADTLYAIFELDRATIFQKARQPFTERDVELHDAVFKLYGMHTLYSILQREPPFTRE